MKQVYQNALSLKMRRIKQCGNALRTVTDEFSISYWNKELALAQYELVKIQRRINLGL